MTMRTISVNYTVSSTQTTTSLSLSSSSSSSSKRLLSSQLRKRKTHHQQRLKHHKYLCQANTNTNTNNKQSNIKKERDVVLVLGCLDRTAQCSAEQLSQNERSRGARVVCSFPPKAYEGIKNPFNAMDVNLVYPNEKVIKAMNELEFVEVLNEESKEFQKALPNVTAIIIADEFAPNLLKSTQDIVALVNKNKLPNLKRMVCLSHIGIERRDQDPYKMMNRKVFRGGAILDRFADAEELIKLAAPKGNPLDAKWTYTIVRVGDLRGNGPCSVAYGDAMLTLVDNAFDVRMQDIDMERGDEFNGFTKRMSAACVMNRMLTSNKVALLNQTFSLISVGPVSRDRRKGYDVAKGRSPPPIEDEDIDEAVQPKEGEAGEKAPDAVPEGA